MRRIATLALAAALAAPVVPAPFGEVTGTSTARADDDDDFSIPRFRFSAPRIPTIPRIPRFNPPRAPRAAPPAVRAPAPAVRDARPGEIVVGEMSEAQLQELLAGDFTLIESAPLAAGTGVVARLRPPAGVDIEAARTRVRALAPAAIVEPNHLYRPVEAAPCSGNHCPAFAMVGWMLPAGRCTVNAAIGMVDTTVNLEHEALRDQGIEKVSVIAKDDRAGSAVHGTAIAALLVGSAGSRTPGLLPDARLTAVEAFHRDAGGDTADAYAIVRGIDLLAARDIPVINLSFAGPANALLAEAVARAIGDGAVLVAAAGNVGPAGGVAYPAAYDGVIAVTAVDVRGQVYQQAGRGDHIAFAAPGVQLWTAASVSGGRYRSGTSYAAPFVSAAIAAARHGDPAITTESIVRAIAAKSDDLGDKGRDPVYGFGLVRAEPCVAGRGG